MVWHLGPCATYSLFSKVRRTLKRRLNPLLMKQRMTITFETEETVVIKQTVTNERPRCPNCGTLIAAKIVSSITRDEVPPKRIVNTRGSYEKGID